METSFGTDGTEPGNSFPSQHFVSGWCPECGRRRGADARCGNCDPWWTSPLVQAGIPAVLGVLFLMTTASALIKRMEKPQETVVARSGENAPPLTVKVTRSYQAPQTRTASVGPALSSVAVPTVDPASEVARVQREGAYINAVLKAQDEARQTQRIAARNREYSLALQQHLQAIAQARSQSRFAYPAPELLRSSPVPKSPSRLEQVITEETIVVPQ